MQELLRTEMDRIKGPYAFSGKDIVTPNINGLIELSHCAAERAVHFDVTYHTTTRGTFLLTISLALLFCTQHVHLIDALLGFKLPTSLSYLYSRQHSRSF